MKLKELIEKYEKEGFTITTTIVENVLHIVVKDKNGIISEEFDVIKMSKN